MVGSRKVWLIRLASCLLPLAPCLSLQEKKSGKPVHSYAFAFCFLLFVFAFVIDQASCLSLQEKKSGKPVHASHCKRRNLKKRLLPLVAREEIWKTGPADAFAASPPSQLNDKGDDQEKLSKLRLFKKTMQGKRKFYLVSRLEEHKLSRWPSYSFKLQIFFSLSYFKTLLCSLFRNYIFVRTEIFANTPKLLRVELMKGKY